MSGADEAGNRQERDKLTIADVRAAKLWHVLAQQAAYEHPEPHPAAHGKISPEPSLPSSEGIFTGGGRPVIGASGASGLGLG